MATKAEVVAERDAALTRRNEELRFLRRLVSQLKRRAAELESRQQAEEGTSAQKPVMDIIYRARRAAFDWIEEQGLSPSIENIVIALNETGYLRDKEG